MAKHPTPIDVDDFLVEHLPYEVHMLRATYVLLRQVPVTQEELSLWPDGPTVDRQRVATSALIGSFCVHARNLIEFFRASRHCSFDPREFAVDGYVLRREFMEGPIIGKLSQQLSHLTANRTRPGKTEGKIDGPMREKILRALESEIDRLTKNLKPDVRTKWAVVPREPSIVEPVHLSLSATVTSVPNITVGIIKPP